MSNPRSLASCAFNFWLLFLALQRASSSSHRVHWVSAKFAEKRSTSRPHKKIHTVQKNIKECMRSAWDEYMNILNICFRQWRHLVYTCEWSKAGQGRFGGTGLNGLIRWPDNFFHSADPSFLPCFLASLLDLASEQDEQVPPKAVLPPRDSETHISQELPGMHLCAWWRLWLLKAANRDFIIWFYATATLKPENMTFQAIQARAAKEVFTVK